MEVTLEEIIGVVRQIVEECSRPQKVILFGSHTHGSPTGYSDLGLSSRRSLRKESCSMKPEAVN